MSHTPTDHPPAPRVALGRGGIVTGVVVGLVTLALLLWFGPRPLRPSGERTGDAALAAWLADHAPAGTQAISAFVVEDGRVRFAGLGADEHTRFEIGSLTKTFTAELLADLVKRGTLKPTTRVADVLDLGGAPVGDVTLKELADHTSGLPRLGGTSAADLLGLVVERNPYAGISDADVIEQARTAKLSKRGERAYSNLGAALLGQALAKAGGASYGELVEQRILRPLGMNDTRMESGDDTSVPGHNRRGHRAAPWVMGGYAPAGALVSTGADMAKYAQHLLKKGLADWTWIDGWWHNGATGGFSSFLGVRDGKAVYAVTNTTASVTALGKNLMEA